MYNEYGENKRLKKLFLLEDYIEEKEQNQQKKVIEKFFVLCYTKYRKNKEEECIYGKTN